MNQQNKNKDKMMAKAKGILIPEQKPLSNIEKKVGEFEGVNLREIEDMFEVVTSTPTGTPKGDFYSFFKIYYDSISSPTVRRLYMFVPVVEEWTYITLTV